MEREHEKVSSQDKNTIFFNPLKFSFLKGANMFNIFFLIPCIVCSHYSIITLLRYHTQRESKNYGQNAWGRIYGFFKVFSVATRRRMEEEIHFCSGWRVMKMHQAGFKRKRTRRGRNNFPLFASSELFQGKG